MPDDKGYSRVPWKPLQSASVWLIPSTRRLMVSRLTHGREAVMISPTAEAGIAYGYWCESEWAFRIEDRNQVIAEGRFSLAFSEERKTSVRSFSITVFNTSASNGTMAEPHQLVNDRFSKMLMKVAFHTPFLIKGHWHEPGEVLYLKDRKPVRAPASGKFIPVRSNFRRPRNSDHHWQEASEIARIVDLYSKAQRVLPASASQREIEDWIAQRSGTWSASTVHRQLQIARDTNKIKRKKRGRKGKR